MAKRRRAKIKPTTVKKRPLATRPTPKPDQNMRVARQAFGAWNAHDPDKLVKLIAQGYVSESDTLPAPTRGSEGARQAMQIYINAFPDLHLDIEQMTASGDYVITRWRGAGTHRGDLMGIPPTNRWAEVHGCSVAEYKNGKIVHEWVYWDTGHLLRQLGVLPAPPPR